MKRVLLLEIKGHDGEHTTFGRLWEGLRGLVAVAVVGRGSTVADGFFVPNHYAAFADGIMWRDWIMSLLRRPSVSSKPGVADGPSYDPEFAAKWPGLHEYLTALVWPSGGERKTSTLLIFAEQGTFKACLNERDSLCTLWAAASSVEGVLGALETLLEQEQPPWRESSQGGGTKRKK
jgi:hypothetical protein